MTENNNRAVITGLGMICAIGNSVDEAWNNAINSVSGIHKTTTLDTTDCYADLAAEVKCDTLGDFEGSEDADRSAQLCIKAAGEAMKDAGLDDFAGNPKASVIIGSCVGGAVSISDYYEHGKKASDVTKMPISSIAPQVAGQCHAGGVVTNIANACAAGTISIAYACELIRAGKADVVLAGGSDTFAAVHSIYRYDDRTGSCKSFRYTGTRRVYSNDEGGKCFFIDLCIHRQCGFAVCFPEPWRKQNPAHQKRLPRGIDAGCMFCCSRLPCH